MRIIEEKTALRQKMANWRQALDKNTVAMQSCRLSDLLLREMESRGLLHRSGAKIIGLYHAFRQEADPIYAVPALVHNGWILAYPLVLTRHNRSLFPALPPDTGMVFLRPDDMWHRRLLERLSDLRHPADAVREQLMNWLQCGHFGLMEPPAEALNVVVPDLIIIPGLAFDRQGNRLGWGRGYYDQYLAACPRKPLLWAAALQGQVLETVPADAQDQPIDAIITPEKVIHVVK